MLKSYEIALEIMQNAVSLEKQTASTRKFEETIQKEFVTLNSALGRISRETIAAHEQNPPFVQSSMDGFATRAEWFRDASPQNPILLPIIALIAAGKAEHLSLSQVPSCIEIMTGAPLPEGFDTVIRYEDAETITTDRDPLHPNLRNLLIKEPVSFGTNVRSVGCDFATGDVIISKGEKVTASHVMVLASQGILHLPVHPKIRIALICTGSEIVSPSELPEFGQIRNATASYLESLGVACNLTIDFLGLVRDDPEALKKHILDHCDCYDVILTTGAVSAGVFDFVPSAVTALGAQILFHKVAVRPGKPVLFAKIPKGPWIFGFPGNPISSAVAFRFFLLPFIQMLTSNSVSLKSDLRLRLPLLKQVRKPKELVCFFIANLKNTEKGETCVEVLESQESFRLKGLTQGTHWAVLPQGMEVLNAGEYVDIYPTEGML